MDMDVFSNKPITKFIVLFFYSMSLWDVFSAWKILRRPCFKQVRQYLISRWMSDNLIFSIVLNLSTGVKYVELRLRWVLGCESAADLRTFGLLLLLLWWCAFVSLRWMLMTWSTQQGCCYGGDMSLGVTGVAGNEVAHTAELWSSQGSRGVLEVVSARALCSTPVPDLEPAALW